MAKKEYITVRRNLLLRMVVFLNEHCRHGSEGSLGTEWYVALLEDINGELDR